MVKSFVLTGLDPRLSFGREVPALSLAVGKLIPGRKWCAGTAAMLDLIDLPIGLRHAMASSMAHTGHTQQARNAGIRSGISGGEGSRTPVLKTIAPNVYMLS